MSTAENLFTDSNAPAEAAGQPQQLATAAKQLTQTNEKLWSPHEQLSATQQLQVCKETIRAQANKLGQPFRQAVPELAGQLFFSQLDAVYRTGETCTDPEVAVTLDRT